MASCSPGTLPAHRTLSTTVYKKDLSSHQRILRAHAPGKYGGHLLRATGKGTAHRHHPARLRSPVGIGQDVRRGKRIDEAGSNHVQRDSGAGPIRFARDSSTPTVQRILG